MFKKILFKTLILCGVAAWIGLAAWLSIPAPAAFAQQPTGSIATVTGTPTGPMITVYQGTIGVYAGPSTYNYDQIGILIAGEKAPALGYSADGNWIEIIYLGVPGAKGWVYGPLVSISTGDLPALVAPPTATPRTTATLNPTYAAAFGVQSEPTRLPTFTAPPALKIPTFTVGTGGASKIPFGLVILILALIGVLGAVISFLRGNR
ncbi:MAG TPA: hypothetical protein VMC09_02935 [Anaerolineales bacterium]|nr:hypothetical protein [Anaerolineales bacterium]